VSDRRLRILPLGGLGEIGKNMTVVEYDGRIVVVDCGLRFPTSDMLGIDLVLPDFAYLRERVDDIEAIVVTHGHEDHLGALPWVLRELGQDLPPSWTNIACARFRWRMSRPVRSSSSDRSPSSSST
jgi:ribonuclease J